MFEDLKNISLLDLANWDGRHFLEIAKNGYLNKDQYAFFPLYPLSINLFSKILRIDFLYAAILINLAASFGSIYLFLRISQKYTKGVIKALAFFLIFPTSFYLIAVYSESLFLFLSLLTFFFAEKKNFYISAFFASLALLTRITGIAVIVGLGFYLYNSSFKEKLAVFLISISGFGLYSLYSYEVTGELFYFLTAEKSWGRSLTLPGLNIFDSIIYIASAGVRSESYTILSDLVFTVFGLGMGIRALKFLKPPLAAFTLISLLIPLSTGLLLSIPRFLAVIFPIFLIASKINKRIFDISYVIISLVLLFLYFNFFLRNIWVS